jgi:hypothetical protein
MTNGITPEKQRALDAIDAAVTVHEKIKGELDGLIAQKKAKGLTVDAERQESAALIQRLSRLRNRRAELAAAAVVVSAPTVQELEEVKRLVQTIKNQAIAGAMFSAGLKAAKDLAAKAENIANKAKTS